jgi:ubiquinone/menaquinone biosynthesis C-methylase UbiE
LSDWIRSHVVDVPNEVAEFCGDVLRGSRVLNVGCGEMLTDLGLLGLGPQKITGLDVTSKDSDWLGTVANKVHLAGINFSSDYNDRLSFVQYDGLVFPFEDESFDVVLSWSAFEHVRDIQPVLKEMRRVLAPGGHVFIQVFPWYHSRFGSHLTDYISEPFFQTKQSPEWVKAQLEAYVAATPGANSEFVLDYMLDEYMHLNKLSPSQFYNEVVEAGFVVTKARLISYDEDLSQAPKSVDFADLMIGGTKMLLRAA